MQINWKVRLRHPAFYAAMAALVGFILMDFGVMDAGRFSNYVQLLLAVLTAGGIIVDFTTAGVPDSKQALTYDEPKGSDETNDGDGFY